MLEDLKRLQEIIAYQFKDIELLELALTHRSIGYRNNERLEFLGDAVFSLVTADILFQESPKAREGHLTRMRANLVKESSLADLAREFELGNYLRLGAGELKSGGFRRDSILSDTVEAIIGAIFIESGLEAAKNCIIKWYGARIDSVAEQTLEKDPKSLLQEYLQAKHLPLANYEVIQTKGDEHNKYFVVQCTVDGFEESASGESSRRRKAEQKAALLLLEKLRDS